MLIRFSVSNFKSFRDTAVLSMQADAIKEHPENTLALNNREKLLRSAAIFGANAAGKSNLTKAITAALIIIRLSENRQINEPLPLVEPFMFSEDRNSETSFEFEFIAEKHRYIYGFSCTAKHITEEHLISYSSQRQTNIFRRNGQEFVFFNNETKKQLMPLTAKTAENKLFLATATSWNAELTRIPFLWLKESIDVFNSYNPSPQSLEFYENDKTGELKEFTNHLLKEADINIDDFTVESREVKNPIAMFQVNVPAFSKEYMVMTNHAISGEDEKKRNYQLPLLSESKGTQNLFLLSPWIKKALDNGYVFCVDELDSSMHPALLLYIVELFNSPETNPNGAQLIMTTHTTDLLTTSLMRRDQILFVEKSNDTGVSELYSLNDFPVRTREDIRKAYLAGRFGAVPNIL